VLVRTGRDPLGDIAEAGAKKDGVGAALRGGLIDYLEDTTIVIKRRKRLWSMQESDWTQVAIAR